MKLFRFMSFEELSKYNSGEELINNTDHNKENNLKSFSKGFCFLNYAHFKPEEAYHFINGCTGKLFQYDVCVIFEVDRDDVIQTRARYAEPINPKDIQRYNNRKVFIAKEYCTTKYSNKNFKILKVARIDWSNYIEWEWHSI